MEIHTILNKDAGTQAEVSDIILIDCLKLAKHRNKKLYNALVDIYEQLHKKTFDEDLLKY